MQITKMCSWPCYPSAALCPCGGCGPSGYYDPCFGPYNGPFNSWCGASGPGFWGGRCC
ncbi:male-specific sperm protein Mst87F [Drosophila subobscura]|nr:male-specific sperm protein Mst87F [Drosophila subobscura]